MLTVSSDSFLTAAPQWLRLRGGSQKEVTVASALSLQIVVAYGEHRSLFYIVDAQAPEGEQPCVLETCASRAQAREAIESLSHKGGGP